jgi:hypothetical protein
VREVTGRRDRRGIDADARGHALVEALASFWMFAIPREDGHAEDACERRDAVALSWVEAEPGPIVIIAGEEREARQRSRHILS